MLPVVPLAAGFRRLMFAAGGKDILADPEDTIILLRHLPKVQAHHHEPSYGMCKRGVCLMLRGCWLQKAASNTLS